MRILFFIYLSFTAFSQDLVEGNIKDSKGNIISGANIYISSTKEVLFSNIKGDFYIKIPSEKFKISISHVGYITKEITIISNEKKYYEITLEDGILLSDEIKVTSTRVKENSPFAFSNISRNFIEENNIGRDIPFLIQSTPSAYSTSDAGNGVGYTGVRIRGSDATRINVTINGVPYNDSESHGVFWVNMPDLASSSSSIQVQRGVGSSTNGGGAFGGTVSIKTGNLSEKFTINYSSSGGSFKTFKNSFEINSGLIKNALNFNLRLSKITSDGYIDRASSDLKSYYASASYYSKKTSIDFINFSGKEKTYQSWWGTPESRLSNDIEGMNQVIINNGYTDLQAKNLLEAGRTFNYYTYDNETDNYQQDHYQTHVNHSFSKNTNLHLTFHYTFGRGYYEQYREADNLKNYYEFGEDKTTDLVRRRWLKNHFYGITYSFLKEFNNSSLNIGGALNKYDGDHFGEIISSGSVDVFFSEPYYFSGSTKKDANVFTKYNINISSNTELFTELQLRSYSHNSNGTDNDKSKIKINSKNVFFNPKIGITNQLSKKLSLYSSFSIANREPIRSDFIDSNETPKHETLYDLELGKIFNYKMGSLTTNFFWMEYNNQLITTGEINDVGANIRTNVKKSRRFGVEISNLINTRKININSSLSLSKNYVFNFNEYLYDYGNDFSEFNTIINKYKKTDISFSPNIIVNNSIIWAFKKPFSVSLKSKFVGKQYLDNTSDSKRSIDPFLLNDFELNVNLNNNFLKNLYFKFSINNIFNEVYSNNGYTFGYYGGLNYEVRENYYYPQAVRNYMLTINFKI
tara:strand:+ start:6954 stop:9362 length:2409 start_codon:yes stop_codon:yes gene_type:complete